MTALIKTIIAAVIGMFGCMDIDQTMAERTPLVKEQKMVSYCNFYRPSRSCANIVNSYDWLNFSSPS